MNPNVRVSCKQKLNRNLNETVLPLSEFPQPTRSREINSAKPHETRKVMASARMIHEVRRNERTQICHSYNSAACFEMLHPRVALSIWRTSWITRSNNRHARLLPPTLFNSDGCSLAFSLRKHNKMPSPWPICAFFGVAASRQCFRIYRMSFEKLRSRGRRAGLGNSISLILFGLFYFGFVLFCYVL